MGTTALYVELVIIGLETAMWIAAFSIYLTDVQYISLIGKLLGILPASVLLLGILYILGLITDRVADYLFDKEENKIRLNSGLHAKSSILIWKKSSQEEYFKFTRSKIRILRASAINLPLFTVSIVLNVSRYYGYQTNFLGFIVILGTALSLFSLYGYKQSTENYYNKARILEITLEGRECAN